MGTNAHSVPTTIKTHVLGVCHSVKAGELRLDTRRQPDTTKPDKNTGKRRGSGLSYNYIDNGNIPVNQLLWALRHKYTNYNVHYCAPQNMILDICIVGRHSSSTLVTVGPSSSKIHRTAF